MLCQGFWPRTGLESDWCALQASWVIPMWNLPYPQFLEPRAIFSHMYQPAMAASSVKSFMTMKTTVGFSIRCQVCAVWHAQLLVFSLAHVCCCLFSVCLHLLPSTFTSQSVVPSLATSQVPLWPADTGSESASRHLGDSGQILFHVTCYSLTYSAILSHCLATLAALLARSVLFIATYSGGA